MAEIHDETHLLVRYSQKQEPDLDKGMNIEQRLSSMQKKMDDALERVQAVHGSRMEMEQELMSLREDVQSRLDRIESLLAKIVSTED